VGKREREKGKVGAERQDRVLFRLSVLFGFFGDFKAQIRAGELDGCQRQSRENSDRDGEREGDRVR